jgi:PAS domain S-box-containing protein
MVRQAKPRHFWRSFSGHMIIGLLAIQVLLTPLLFYGILQFIERGLESQFVDQVRNDTFLYGALLESAVLEQNTEKQIGVLNEAFFNEDLILAEFINSDGTIIRPSLASSFEGMEFEEDFEYGEHGDNVYYIDIPLLNDVNAERLGSLRLGYDEIPTQTRVAEAYRYGATLAGGYALLNILLALFFGYRLLRPVSQLQNMARSIATGDTATSLNVSTKILEISDLATDLDTMRQTLVDQTREVKDREQKLYALLNNAGEGIISIDSNGKIDLFNHAAETIFGYSAEQVLGKNVSIFLPASDEKLHEGYIKNYLATGEAKIIGKEQRLKVQHQDGHLFPVFLTVTKIELDHEHMFIGIFRDLTREEEKDRMLSQAMKMEVVGRMTDGIAHDFNNLLTIILGNLQFLGDDLSDEGRDDDVELIDDAISAAQDGSNLIRQLLVFSRREEPDSKPMEIVEFMEGMRRLLKRTIPEDITLKREIIGDTGTVLIDSNRLESAVLNLAINARDAMPDGGKLLISIGKTELSKPERVAGGNIAPGDYIFIKITDNGIGMSEEVRAQALEPFFTTKTSATGTGLGLSMVHDLMAQLGGGMRIESELGKGTTVTLILPLYEQAVESSIAEQKSHDELPGGDETILVVEDREQVRRFAVRILERLGYSILEAESADEAVEYLQSNDEIDMIFTDIVMPGDMNGRGLAEWVSAQKPAVKILLCTGMESRTGKNRNRKIDFPLLRKPYSAEQLAQAIRSVLETGELPG